MKGCLLAFFGGGTISGGVAALSEMALSIFSKPIAQAYCGGESNHHGARCYTILLESICDWELKGEVHQ